MSQDLGTIKPGIGLGVIRFGMKREQIRLILGNPEEVDNFYLDNEEKCESESWYYDSIGLSLSFESEEDWKLITIEVDSGEYNLHGHTILGISKSKLYTILESLNISDLNEEVTPLDESEIHELISSDSNEINFWLEEEIVSEIQWGPFYKEDDKIVWPSN